MITFSQYITESEELAVVTRLKQGLVKLLDKGVKDGVLQVEAKRMHYSKSEKDAVPEYRVSVIETGTKDTLFYMNIFESLGTRSNTTITTIASPFTPAKIKEFIRTKLVALIKQCYKDAKLEIKQHEDNDYRYCAPRFYAYKDEKESRKTTKDEWDKKHPDEANTNKDQHEFTVADYF